MLCIQRVCCGVVGLMNRWWQRNRKLWQIQTSSGSSRLGMDKQTKFQVKKNSHRTKPHNVCLGAGKPVLCGSRIRLMHVRTRKYLHTYFHSALASRQQQVYAFGHLGDGDIGVLHAFV